MNTQDEHESGGAVAVTLTAGGTSIPAALNGNRTARALADRLPLTITMSRYEHDYCGPMREPLPYDAQDVQNGWTNGDISFDTSGNYLAILYKDEEISQQFGNLVPLGRLTAPPSAMDALDGRIALTIERAEERGA